MATSSKGFGINKLSALSKMRRTIKSHIERTKRSIIAVLPEGVTSEKAEATGQPAAFCYTFGNTLQDQAVPELLSFYPSDKTNSFLLNNLSDALLDGEVSVPQPGETTEVAGFLGERGEIPVRLHRLTALQQVWANRHYTIQLPSEAPVIWVDIPDTQGHFTDHPECAEVVKDALPSELK